MASKFFSDFHGADISCSSPPSVASCSSSSSSHGRAIDRHCPHLRDPLREKYFSRAHSKAKPLASVISKEALSFEYLKGEDITVIKSPSPARERDQVVVLKVSLHCKGCEGKVRKHISKMKGVTSFTTDLATKKVTVIGDVTPLCVLNSISKVKKAQFWSSS